MIEKINEMLALQDATNIQTIGKDWKTRSNEEINWGRAIYMECAELIDHLGWKWWKKQELVDLDQARLEVVDIAHFVFSFALRDDVAALDGGVPAYVQRMFVHIESLHKDLAWGAIACAESLMNLTTRAGLPCKRFALPDLLMTFVQLCHSMGMTLDDLYRLYIAKNVLNKFRQDHGYKEGTYRKTWLIPDADATDVHNMRPIEKEDNEVLMMIVNEFDSDSPAFTKDLYLELSSTYLAAHV